VVDLYDIFLVVLMVRGRGCVVGLTVKRFWSGGDKEEKRLERLRKGSDG